MEESEQSGCGPLCRFMYYTLEEQWDVAKVEFDRLLMSPDLLILARKMSEAGVTGSDDPREVLGDELASVLQSGFANNDIEVLRQLLKNPACLHSLVELLFIEGSDYWMNLLPQQTEEDVAKAYGEDPRVRSHAGVISCGG